MHLLWTLGFVAGTGTITVNTAWNTPSWTAQNYALRITCGIWRDRCPILWIGILDFASSTYSEYAMPRYSVWNRPRDVQRPKYYKTPMLLPSPTKGDLKRDLAVLSIKLNLDQNKLCFEVSFLTFRTNAECVARSLCPTAELPVTHRQHCLQFGYTVVVLCVNSTTRQCSSRSSWESGISSRD